MLVGQPRPSKPVGPGMEAEGGKIEVCGERSDHHDDDQPRAGISAEEKGTRSTGGADGEAKARGRIASAQETRRSDDRWRGSAGARWSRWTERGAGGRRARMPKAVSA